MPDQPNLPLNNVNVEDMVFDLPQPEPIKGFPELRWTGKRPFRSTRFYPAQLKESYGDPVDGWFNRIYWGDNLQVMSHLLKEFRGKVDLVYIDPPFDSKAVYKKKILLKGKSIESDNSNFEEIQYADIWINDEYLQFMYERLILIKYLLSDSGTLCIHTDYHKSSHIRLILDEVFGPKNLINEVIWCYEDIGSRTVKNFKRKHDNILIYRKTESPERIFNVLRKKLSESTIKRYKSYFDENGQITYRQLKASNPGVFAKLKGLPDNLDEVWLDINAGGQLSDWWTDISPLKTGFEEAIGYPTQKPDALIERIIISASNPGSLVLDCFMGSGTTQAVAMKLGRRFIGADINLGAIQTTTKRLERIISEKKKDRQLFLEDGDPLYLNFRVYTVNNYDIFRNPVQAKDLLLEALEIDKFESTDVFEGVKDDYYVKIMPVNRIATREDLNPILNGINYRELDRKIEQSPGSPAIRIMLVCMGHEPDLAARLKLGIGQQYRPEVKVVDILRDHKDLTFKYDSEAEIVREGDELVIKKFYPHNLLQKLSILDENVEDWRELVETIAIDWNFNGDVLQPVIYDNPGKNQLVEGRYKIPSDYGNIRVKITDLLSESFEQTLEL